MSRSIAINRWKKYGLIHDDYNALYEEYINTTHCNHCQKEFKNSKDRCMDHDHETGLFRAIVCRKCNNGDGYIKYPNGYDPKKYKKEYRESNKEYFSNYFKKYREANKEYLSKKDKEYYEENRERISKRNKETYTCGCGSTPTIGDKARHNKTLKHTTWEKTISP